MEFVLRTRVGHYEPNADVFIDEERSDLIVKLELAGADPDSLRIAVGERSLTITGRRLDTTRVRRGSFVQKEIEYGEFAKRIDLPVAIFAEDVIADYSDGILVIALPISSIEYIPATRIETSIIVKRTLI
jgi:HSP20 family protein